MKDEATRREEIERVARFVRQQRAKAKKAGIMKVATAKHRNMKAGYDAEEKETYAELLRMENNIALKGIANI